MEKKEKEKKTFWQELPEYIVIMAVTVLVCTCVICFNKIPSGSMEPTIHVGARTVSWRLPYLIGDPTPDHSDIVVFHSPDENKLLIKRVIGLPGDEIKFVERNKESKSSSLYALSDFRANGEASVRKTSDYMKNYFISRYGAIEDIDFTDIIADVLKGDESDD